MTSPVPLAELTATAPQGVLSLPAFATSPTLLYVTIEIDNPQLQPLSVVATLQPGLDGGGVAIGKLTPFPANAGGTYVLGIPEPARVLLASPAGGAALRLSLEPILPEHPLVEPLVVRVVELAWA